MKFKEKVVTYEAIYKWEDDMKGMLKVLDIKEWARANSGLNSGL
ncbi:unnamed protein product, partial [marine sediment metagenome]